jgi:hypothetical protein
MDGCNYDYEAWHANTFGEHIIGKEKGVGGLDVKLIDRFGKDKFVNEEFVMGMHNKNKDGK